MQKKKIYLCVHTLYIVIYYIAIKKYESKYK